jgi:hypothetical protein
LSGLIATELKLRELHIAPRSVEQVVFWNADFMQLQHPADTYTVLVISPGPDKDHAAIGTTYPWREEIGMEWVTDPIYLQDGYDTAVQTTTGYSGWGQLHETAVTMTTAGGLQQCAS